MSAIGNPIEATPKVLALLDRLHTLSLTQESSLDPSIFSSDSSSDSSSFDTLMRDKFIALDQPKCQFLYLLARSIRALNVIEIGTSFGVSTIYLALAVGSNSATLGQVGKVIATEKESTKVERAREYWSEAGEKEVERWIELREGDLKKTLREGLPDGVDLVLLD
ncbi:MAG: hypothetical protein Q9181_006085, partial [Wetmoreana brouardii]